MATAPPNSSKPTTAIPVAGDYNVTAPVLIDGQATALQVDVNGNLKTTSTGGGGGNVNLTGINGTAPSLTNPLAVELSDGTNPLGVSGNPLYVTGTISASNPSVGATGVAAPTSATEIGIIVAGDLEGVSSSNPLPVSGTVAVSNFPATQPVSGTVTAVQPTGANLHVDVDNSVAVTGTFFQATQPVSGTVAVSNFPGTQPVSGTVVAEIEGHAGATLDSAAGTPNAQAVTVQGNASGVPVPVSGSVTVTQATGANLHVDVDNFPATQPVSGTVAVSNFPATQPVSGTVVAEIEGHAGATLDSAAGTPNAQAVTIQGNASGVPVPISGTVTATVASTTITGNVTVVQPTGTNLHTVVDSGTITAVTAITNALPAGTNTIGKVDILGNAGAILDGTAGTPSVGVLTVQGVSGGTAQPVSGTVVAEIEGHAGATLDSAAGTPNTQAVTIQGNASGVPVPISGSVTATVASTTITGNVTVVQPTGSNLHVDIDNTVPVTLASTTITGTVAVDGALTNNNAAPTATLQGILGAIAETAYSTVTYTTGDMVLPVTDLHGALNFDLQAYAGTALGAGSNYGTSPGAVNVMGVNAFITNTPAFTLASTTITGTVAVDGALTNNNAAPTATLQGVLAAIAETAYSTVTYTTGDMVLPVTDLHGALNQDLQAVAGVALGATAVTTYGGTPAAVNVPAVNAAITNTPAVTLTSTTITGTSTIAGNKTNNNAVPGATNLGVLPAIAATVYTTNTYTNADQVALVTDLNGAINTDLQAVAGNAVVTATTGVQLVGIEGHGGAALDAVTTAATAPVNGLAVLDVYTATVPVLTTGQSLALQADTTGGQYVNQEGRKATFACQIISGTAVSGGNFVLVGSATKVIRITRVVFSGYATAAGSTSVGCQISTPYTGGTSSTTGTQIGPFDSASAAATATRLVYTVAPTGGGSPQSYPITFNYTFAAVATGNIYTWDFGNRAAGCPVLRGTSQIFALFISVAPATCTYTCEFEWTEE
jgi:hypothetical protein